MTLMFACMSAGMQCHGQSADYEHFASKLLGCRLMRRAMVAWLYMVQHCLAS